MEATSNPLWDILGTIGAVADAPGSVVRNTVAGRNPLRGLFSPEHRTSGRDVLQSLGIAGANDPDKWELADIAGFGVEAVTDPLGWLPAGLATKAGRAVAGKAANKAVRAVPGVVNPIAEKAMGLPDPGLRHNIGRLFGRRGEAVTGSYQNDMIPQMLQGKYSGPNAASEALTRGTFFDQSIPGMLAASGEKVARTGDLRDVLNRLLPDPVNVGPAALPPLPPPTFGELSRVGTGMDQLREILKSPQAGAAARLSRTEIPSVERAAAAVGDIPTDWVNASLAPRSPVTGAIKDKMSQLGVSPDSTYAAQPFMEAGMLTRNRAQTELINSLDRFGDIANPGSQWGYGANAAPRYKDFSRWSPESRALATQALQVHQKMNSPAVREAMAHAARIDDPNVRALVDNILQQMRPAKGSIPLRSPTEDILVLADLLDDLAGGSPYSKTLREAATTSLPQSMQNSLSPNRVPYSSRPRGYRD